MATLKQRLHKKNSAGSYDTIYLETSAEMVLMNDGTTVETAVNNKAASNHTHSGYAATTHKHAVSDITSGTLGVARGGTGVTSLDALKTALGITDSGGASGGSGGTSGSTSAGGTMTFDNMSWTVVDNGSYNSDELVLMLTNIYHLMNGYNIERFCTYFWEYVLSNEAKAKCMPHCMKEFGTNAHTIPVFVPTYTEVNGGFTYLSSSGNRIAKYNGTATTWWTSSPDSYSGSNVYCVTTDGGISYYYSPYNAYGFRPFVALRKSAI